MSVQVDGLSVNTSKILEDSLISQDELQDIRTIAPEKIEEILVSLLGTDKGLSKDDLKSISQALSEFSTVDLWDFLDSIEDGDITSQELIETLSNDKVQAI
jgi:hypothetical protein